jgi:hypothetical protein
MYSNQRNNISQTHALHINHIVLNSFSNIHINFEIWYKIPRIGEWGLPALSPSGHTTRTFEIGKTLDKGIVHVFTL